MSVRVLDHRKVVETPPWGPVGHHTWHLLGERLGHMSASWISTAPDTGGPELLVFPADGSGNPVGCGEIAGVRSADPYGALDEVLAVLDAMDSGPRPA